jgi:hypothetical protein
VHDLDFVRLLVADVQQQKLLHNCQCHQAEEVDNRNYHHSNL